MRAISTPYGTSRPCPQLVGARHVHQARRAAPIRVRLEPTREIARMIRVHKPPILNWFAARDEVSLGAVEGPNTEWKAGIRTA